MGELYVHVLSSTVILWEGRITQESDCTERALQRMRIRAKKFANISKTTCMFETKRESTLLVKPTSLIMQTILYKIEQKLIMQVEQKYIQHSKLMVRNSLN